MPRPFLLCALLLLPCLQAQKLPTIEERTAAMRKLDGYFPLYWDERTGNLWLEIPRLDNDFLLATGVAAGLGSNDIGLDRGMEDGGKLVRFERVGPKVLLVQGNESFRSSSANPAERRSVADSFASSILWGFPVGAESHGRVLVDATEFFVRDGMGAGAALSAGAQYRLDRTRCAVYLPRTKAFPSNTEIEVTLTFTNEPTGGRGGGFTPNQGPPPIQIPAPGAAPRGGRGFGGGLFSGTVASVAPTAQAVTLRGHYSLVELPDNNYRPRLDDPRAGYGGPNFVDYSTPIGEPMVRRYIHRHRLEKKDPTAAISDPVKPLEYWVDPGAPEDVRNALIEGASWWNQAFEAAGFRNAFKVAVLPEGADPMDIRYNMINWVHRSTRGWSFGGTVSDPRTGEIIKGTVTLGSLRDRQDYLIFEGLLSPYTTGGEKPDILYQTALARIRQLAAHEVGHTLGLGHNYYDSSQGWISVMDYPHPQEKLLPDGTIDLSQAYPARIGEWDKVSIAYGYSQLPPGDESAALARILDEAWAKDLRYLTNQDLGIRPGVDQWSNGVDQADELNRIMKIRRAALNRLGEHTIRTGAPMATIEEPLVPIFMYHRYSVESAASSIGGPGLHLRHARRWPHSGEVGIGRQSAEGAGGAGQHAEARRVDRAQAGAGCHSAAPAGLRPPPRAVSAHHGRWFRSAQPGYGGRGCHHRFRAAVGPRGPHGGAARRRSRAAGPGGSHRPPDQSHLRRAGRFALRSRGSPRRGARAGGSRDVAGHRRVKQPGARHRGVETGEAGRALKERSSDG